MPNATVRAAAAGLPDDTRRQLADAAQRIIEILDAFDAPSEDLEETDPAEDGGDTEPSLGSTNHRDQSKAWNATHAGDDLEYEGDNVADCDVEDGHDREHDEADLSGIGDLDGMVEQLTGEPSLGATHEIHQGIAWRGAGGPVDGEATCTLADIPPPPETSEQWMAHRKATEDARAQGRGLLRAIGGRLSR